MKNWKNELLKIIKKWKIEQMQLCQEDLPKLTGNFQMLDPISESSLPIF